MNHIFDGRNRPTRNFFFQLCDITDPDIVHIINNKAYLKNKVDVGFILYHHHHHHSLFISIPFFRKHMDFITTVYSIE
jgi:hypothetical protein